MPGYTTNWREGKVVRTPFAEAGFGQEALPTFPASAFVAAGKVAALLEHATEYELLDEGSELALTPLRPTGQIPLNRPAHRDEPAGPVRGRRTQHRDGPARLTRAQVNAACSPPSRSSS
ncbi:hypothetical protein [Streptomyces sp. NPDC001661]